MANLFTLANISLRIQRLLQGGNIDWFRILIGHCISPALTKILRSSAAAKHSVGHRHQTATLV